MFPLMFFNDQRIRQLQSQVIGLEGGLALIWQAVRAINSSVAPKVVSGSGSPEGVTTADVPTVYIDVATPSAPVIYWKTSGSGNTGWVS